MSPFGLRNSPFRFASLYVALFASGVAALVYQTAWSRMLQRVFGVSDYAVATVLATFFLGLGLGSEIGGRLIARFRKPALVYGALELGVALWAAFSLVLLPNLHRLYAGAGDWPSYGLVGLRIGLAALLLLPPTTMMGATLPVLVRAVTAREGEGSWSARAASLYSVNTLGAVLGAGGTGLWLLPAYGTRFAVLAAAVASASAGLLVLAVYRSDSTDAAPRNLAPLTTAAKRAMLLAGLSGFASLASEVLWTRVLRIVVHGTTQAFAAMLVNFLLGIALGSALAERLARGRDPLRLFAIAHVLLALLTAIAILVATELPRASMLLQGRKEVVPHDPWTVVGLSAMLLFPLAVAVGTTIPFAWRVAGGDSRTAAVHTGHVLAANTFGGLLGSVVCGFVLIPTLGVEKSIYFIGGIYLLAAAVAYFERSPRLVLIPLAVAVGIFVSHPSLKLPFLLDAWSMADGVLLHGSQMEGEKLLFLEEGRNTTVTVLEQDNLLRLFNDGRPESGISLTEEPGFGEELATLGVLPTVFAAQTERAMVIGLGAGHSTTMLLAGPWQHVNVVELEEAVPRAARLLHRRRNKPFPLDDERTSLRIDDARAQLVLSREAQYDAIVSQPSHPWLAGSSALYTQEFFREAERALKPGGVIALWANLFRIETRQLRSILRTVLSVFSHASVFISESSSFIIVAGHERIRLGQRSVDRLSGDSLRPFLEPFQLSDFLDFAAVLELDSEGARAFAASGEIIVDDRPMLELELARIPHGQGLALTTLDRAFASIPWMSAQTLSDVPEELRLELVLARLREAQYRRSALTRIERNIRDLPLSEWEKIVVSARIAEYRGDIGAALQIYQRHATSAARVSRARLLATEHRYDILSREFASADFRTEDPEPYFRAAMALRQREMASALALPLRNASSGAMPAEADLAQAYGSGQCVDTLRVLREHSHLLEDSETAELAASEALDCNERRLALDWLAQAGRRRQFRAREEYELGEEATNDGNTGLASTHYRRAFLHDPGNTPAAIEWIETLAMQNRVAEASVALERAYEHAVSPSDRSSLDEAKDRLSL